MAEPTAVTVKILDKEYRVACPEDEVESLRAAVDYVNERMRALRDSGKVIGAERIAVMAALNIAHEYLDFRRHNETVSGDIGAAVRRMQAKIAQALGSGDRGLHLSDVS